MPDRPTCPDCGAELPPGSPRDPCPRCLLRTGLAVDPARPSRASGHDATLGPMSPGGAGVLGTIAETIGPVPHVMLRDTTPDEAPGPLVRPDAGAADSSLRYRIDGEIARGGMGAVLKGRDPDLGREVALKVLREDLRDRPELVRRFIEEAQIGGQLQHPGIVPIYELGTFADRRPFFSMKLVKGHTLAQLLEQRPGPSAELSRHLATFEAICQTVAYAHARGVIHRDLKPSNVMVGSFGEVQVMDWGLAKVLPRGGVADDAAAGKAREDTVIATARGGGADSAELSLAGSVLGTPSYMAPEQARGEIDQVDERADVFALGSILCEVLTGEPAFVGRKAAEILRKSNQGDTADALARLAACGADAELVSLARDCLAPEREDRPRDASAVAERVTAYLAGVQERVRRAELASVEERARRRLTTVVAASLLALVTAGGLGGTYWLHQRQAAAGRTALALKEATLLRDQAVQHPEDPARWPAAVAALERARAALAEGGDREARDQLAALGGAIEAGARAAEDDRELMARLVEIRGEKADDRDGSATDAAYAAAFRDAGIDVDALGPEAAGARIVDRPEPVRRALVAALDHWALIRKSRRARGIGWPRLVAAARAADPDPDREALRAALAIEDDARRLERVRPLAERTGAGDWAPASLALLATTLADAGDVEAGVRVLRRAAGAHPTDAWIHFGLGALLGKTSPPRTREAIEAYNAARALKPELGHELAHALEKERRYEEAEAVFRDLVGRSENARHLLCLGIHLRDRGRRGEAGPYLDRAIAASRKAIALDPKVIHSHTELGRALVGMDRKDESVAPLRKAVELDPGLAEAHATLGEALRMAGRVDEAIASFRKAIELDPKLVMAHLDLGVALVGRGGMDEAIACWRKAIELDSTHVLAHRNLGKALAATGRVDEAIAFLSKANELDPTDASTYFTLGNVLTEAGRVDEAIASLRKAIELGQKGVGPSLARAKRLATARDRFADYEKGRYTPATAADRLELARWCRTSKRPHTAARLAAEAFAEPKLADDLKSTHRYGAACSASLAAAGLGQDAADLDDAERARLRKQALDWLRADLALRTRKLEGGQPADRTLVWVTMRHWQRDGALAAIRDPGALAKLPEAERKDCEALWRDVEALRQRAKSQARRTP